MDARRISRRPEPGRLLGRALALLLAVGAFTVSTALAEDPPPAPPAPPPAGPPAPPPGSGVGPNVNREAMWPAPTADDWKKPCLITWQRTWADAVAVARESGRPILICINMDGEIASEHYAGVRYRQPEITALYEPYVTVIASVYRHTPRDHDENGQRVPCPRFGGVTCGEHIAIEPGIFERYCDGRRIAPRHILVELDGSETFDVYYRWDTASVFQDIRDGIAKRPPLPPTIVRGDRPVVERVASRDVRDRSAVESAYASGDPALRRSLLDAALAHGEAAQLDLLRLAVFGLDVELSRSARQALTKVDAPEATTLVAEALRVPMEAAERDALIATLKRLGASSVLARWLAVVHQGLADKPGAVDPSLWPREGAGGTATAPVYEGGDLETFLELKARAARDRPADPAPRLEVAEASLALAFEAEQTHADDPRRARMAMRSLLADAQRLAREAQALGATGWRVSSVLALAAYYAGDLEQGYARAAEAVKDLPPGDGSWSSMALLTVFAESRWKAIKKAVKERLDFPPEWLGDVHAAYAALLRHPLGTDGQVLWHHDLLDWLGADDQAGRILTAGIKRFTGSALLHERLRAHLLKRRGLGGLRTTYDALLAESPDAPALLPFAAQAAVAAAEQRRRAKTFEAALEDYARAAALYERAGAPEPLALVLASRARVAYELGRDDEALEAILASFAKSPATAGTRDGMGITPGETGQMLLARLAAQGRTDEGVRLDQALGALDPDLLRPDRP